MLLYISGMEEAMSMDRLLLLMNTGSYMCMAIQQVQIMVAFDRIFAVVYLVVGAVTTSGTTDRSGCT
jgi:hypothetical protein